LERVAGLSDQHRKRSGRPARPRPAAQQLRQRVPSVARIRGGVAVEVEVQHAERALGLAREEAEQRVGGGFDRRVALRGRARIRSRLGLAAQACEPACGAQREPGQRPRPRGDHEGTRQRALEMRVPRAQRLGRELTRGELVDQQLIGSEVAAEQHAVDHAAKDAPAGGRRQRRVEPGAPARVAGRILRGEQPHQRNAFARIPGAQRGELGFARLEAHRSFASTNRVTKPDTPPPSPPAEDRVG